MGMIRPIGMGLFGFLFLVSCSQDSPQSTQLQSTPLGTYRVVKVLCNGQESSIVTSALLASNVQITIQFAQSGAIRTTNFFGCIQTVPMTPMSYSAPNIVNITEDGSSCQEGTAGACGSIPAQCHTASFSYQTTYENQGSTLIFHVPPNPQQDPPCGPSQGSSDVEFVLNQL